MNDMLKKVYTRLCFFTRYRDTPTNQKESIAEHQYFVALISKILCDKYKLDAMTELRVLRMALIHDIGESYSDDFTYEMKYSKGSENFRKSLELVEDNIMREIDKDLGYKELKVIYNDYKKRQNLESKIVKLADWYSVLLFCETELLRGENKPIKKIYKNCILRIKKLDGDIYAIVSKRI